MILCVCDDLSGGLAGPEDALYIEMCERSTKKIAQLFFAALFTIGVEIRVRAWRILYVKQGNLRMKALCQWYGEPSRTETAL